MSATKPHPRRLGWFYHVTMAFLGLFDRWLHLSCRSFVQVASEKHERPLTRWERVRQAIHRAMCGVCRVNEQRMDALRELVQEVSRSAGDDLDATLSEEARARIRAAMAEAARSRPGEEPGAD